MHIQKGLKKCTFLAPFFFQLLLSSRSLFVDFYKSMKRNAPRLASSGLPGESPKGPKEPKRAPERRPRSEHPFFSPPENFMKTYNCRRLVAANVPPGCKDEHIPSEGSKISRLAPFGCSCVPESRREWQRQPLGAQKCSPERPDSSKLHVFSSYRILLRGAAVTRSVGNPTHPELAEGSRANW